MSVSNVFLKKVLLKLKPWKLKDNRLEYDEKSALDLDKVDIYFEEDKLQNEYLSLSEEFGISKDLIDWEELR